MSDDSKKVSDEKTSTFAKKRYDRKHPVVSYRVTDEEYGRLKAVLTKQNKTMKGFFRQALGLEERNYKEARRAGYAKGFNDAKEKYAVWLYCAACGEGIEVTDEDVKEEMVASYEKAAVHEGCCALEDVDPETIIMFKRKEYGKKR